MTSTRPPAVPVPLPPPPWPYGPARPGVATTAAWLGRATAAWTSLLAVALLAGGAAWPAAVAVLAACTLAVGARRLLAGRGRALLMAAAAVAALVLAVAGSRDGELRADGTAGVLLWLLWALSLPVLTVAFAGLPRVGGWLSGRVPAGPLPYAPPPALWPADAWPHGAPRPGAATAAAVLGVVTGALTLATVTGALLGAALSGPVDDPVTLALAPGLPCAAGLVTGGVLLLRRRSRTVLLVAAHAAALVLLAAAGVAHAASVPDREGAWLLVGVALPFPVVAAGLALRGDVRTWLAAPRGPAVATHAGGREPGAPGAG